MKLDITNVMLHLKYMQFSILRISSFTQNSILLKLSLKDNGILLNNFKTKTFYCIVLKLGANAHFPQYPCIIEKRNYEV